MPPRIAKERPNSRFFLKNEKKIEILGPEKGSKIGPKMAPKKGAKKVTPQNPIFTLF